MGDPSGRCRPALWKEGGEKAGMEGDPARRWGPLEEQVGVGGAPAQRCHEDLGSWKRSSRRLSLEGTSLDTGEGKGGWGREIV